MGLDLVDIDLRVILDDELDLFLLFIFDLNQLIVPDNTKTLDNLVSFCRKARKYFLEYFTDIIALYFLHFLSQFGIVQDHIIVELVIFLNYK
jgi:hypothetical protein